MLNRRNAATACKLISREGYPRREYVQHEIDTFDTATLVNRLPRVIIFVIKCANNRKRVFRGFLPIWWVISWNSCVRLRGYSTKKRQVCCQRGQSAPCWFPNTEIREIFLHRPAARRATSFSFVSFDGRNICQTQPQGTMQFGGSDTLTDHMASRTDRTLRFLRRERNAGQESEIFQESRFWFLEVNQLSLLEHYYAE